ncbi:KH domain-containing protein [Phormidium tenue]|uniref:RNA-binding protein n=1 Tax=Phormidium tenue NIES-30 TaxID=549789 RepID=A0A1U7J857_9CYAN|nr:KH domain-containing protein [Phormidium tenue]MBD2231264.1 KH domain-containing protein [Phormidium tenue FACHB-1052]OKH49509.1 RNA-binding protein [Phormidium tenue NIES-30]
MNSPDFPGLVRFLVEPFLDSPASLRIDCEENAALSKVWIRIAFKGDERGKVFGRGGRNIQAIRTVVRATAALSGWSAYVDVYGASEQETGTDHRSHSGPSQRSSGKPKPQLRPKV